MAVRRWWMGIEKGRTNVKVEPFPTSLSTSICPPRTLTDSSVRASPAKNDVRTSLSNFLGRRTIANQCQFQRSIVPCS